MDFKIQNLRKLLKEKKLDALLLSSNPNITYLTGFNGFSALDRDAFVLITQHENYIFTHGIYTQAVKQKVPYFKLIEIKRENPIDSALKSLIVNHSVTRLGFEAFDLKVSEYERLIKQIPKRLLTSSDIVAELRKYKSEAEIAAIKKACQLGDKAFTYITSQLKPEVTEKEVAALLDFFIKSNGAEISFPTIVAFEENAAHPHHVPTNKKLKTENFVLLDFGVLLNNYCSDMTRTISFGKATDEKKKIYQTVYDSQKKSIEFLNSQLSTSNSVNASAVDKVARDHILSQGFPSMPHSLGHGIGLEVHEAPRLTPVSKETLENGMVFSIEPGIYLPGNVGVRIEDLFTIQDNKLIQLTKSHRELTEI